MTAKEILAELQPLGSASYKKLLMNNHGVREPFFGVKIGDLKKIQKRIKTNHQLALDLYDTSNYDAMYLAGLVADDARMSRKDLERWVASACGGALAGYTVPWVAAGSQHGWELALKWIASPRSHVAEAGWSTLANLVAMKEDSQLDLPALKRLLERVGKTIEQSAGPVRYAMNQFLIAVGSYVQPLHEQAIQAGKKLAPITADLGNNQCQIPYAPDAIEKAVSKRGITKRKMVKC